MNKLYKAAVVLLQRSESKRVKRFLVVGISNTLVSFVTYLVALALLPQAHGMASLAQAISYSAGILWSYIWNRIWVFGSSGHVLKEGGRFLAVQVALMLTSAALIGLMVDSFNANRVWSWIIVMGFITVLNYVLLRFWTFRNHDANLP